MAPSRILNSHLACTLPLRTLAQLSGPFPISPVRLASRYTWSRKAMQSVMTCFGDPSDKSQMTVECDVSHGMLSGSTGSPSRCSLSLARTMPQAPLGAFSTIRPSPTAFEPGWVQTCARESKHRCPPGNTNSMLEANQWDGLAWLSPQHPIC